MTMPPFFFAILQLGDIILVADGTGANPVAFSSDARKAFADAIADAEASTPATLKLLASMEPSSPSSGKEANRDAEPSTKNSRSSAKALAERNKCCNAASVMRSSGCADRQRESTT